MSLLISLLSPSGGGGGGGTVTSVSVNSANGLSGTVSNPTTTPALTLKTTVTGLLKGNGTAISAATAGTDYVDPSELDGFVPYTGATNQLDLGANSLLANSIYANQLDTESNNVTYHAYYNNTLEVGRLDWEKNPAGNDSSVSLYTSGTDGSLSEIYTASYETFSLSVPLALSGALSEDNGGTGETAYSEGDLLIGNSSGGLTKATLTEGAGITITNGDGSIEISATGGGSSTYAVETPSGAIDGSNKIFTLANTPLLNTQSLYVNGLYQSIPDDYALSADTITFVTAPQIGDKIRITYQY